MSKTSSNCVCLAILLVIGAKSAFAKEGPTKCLAEFAVYEAQQSADDDFKPDILRFDYKAQQGGMGPWTGWPKRAVIYSDQVKRNFVFDTYFTNSSGKEGISLSIPPKELDENLRVIGKPLLVNSDVFSIWPDLDLGALPLKGMEAPRLILLPGFRHFAHSSYGGTISYGIARSVFRFARCDGGDAPEAKPPREAADLTQQPGDVERRISTDEEISAILGARAWPHKATPSAPGSSR